MRTVLFICLAALMAATLAWGPYAHGHNADSLVPVLESLYAWQPFYWEQTRFGMLIPLVALPVKSPLWNLLLQSWLNALGGILAFYLAARYVDRDHWKAAGTIALAAFLMLAAWPARIFFQLVPMYGPSLALAIAALLILDSGWRTAFRVSLATLLMLLATWVNISMPVVAGGILLGRAILDVRGKRPDALIRLLAGEAVVAIAFMAVIWFAGRQPASEGWDGLLTSPAAIIASCRGLSASAVAAFWPLGLALVPLAGVALWKRRQAASGITPLLSGAACYLAAMSVLAWPGRGGYDVRYLLPAAVLITVACAASMARALPIWLDRVAVPAVAVILISMCGAPTPGRARAALDDLGRRTPEVLAAGVTHIAGDYWNVWPAVYHANLVLAERGDARRVWGITFRCRATERYWDWRPLDKWVVAQDIGESPATAEREAGYNACVRLESAGALPHIRLFRAIAPPAAAEE